MKYLVVGGIAVVLHGVNRFTWDVDLAVQLTTENVRRLVRAMGQAGFVGRVPVPAHGLADPKTRKLWVEQRQMKVYSFVERKSPPRMVDVMVKPLRRFDEVYRRRVTVRVHRVRIPLVPVDILMRLKQVAGRPEDLLDIKALKDLGNVS